MQNRKRKCASANGKRRLSVGYPKIIERVFIRNKWFLEDQMNAKQRAAKNAYQRRWRASAGDDSKKKKKKSKSLRDPLKRALAEGKDIFVNRQGKRFMICDCQKMDNFEKYEMEEKPIVEDTDSVNITVKPDILFDESDDSDEFPSAALNDYRDEDSVADMENDNEIDYMQSVEVKLEPNATDSSGDT